MPCVRSTGRSSAAVSSSRSIVPISPSVATWSFADASISEFRTRSRFTSRSSITRWTGIDPDHVRIHVCWGNYPGPHHHDVPLAEILDIVYQVNANGLSIEGANPRHEHEWAVFADTTTACRTKCSSQASSTPVPTASSTRRPWPSGSSGTRRVVGRERVIAGTDCGFGTWPGGRPSCQTSPTPNWPASRKGPRLASSRLW